MLKIFGSTTSPFVRHCRIAALQEGHEFELVIADYATSAKENPTSKVPYMQDGDTFLTDSSSIIHHIRYKGNKTFLPTTAEAELYFLGSTTLDTGINLFLLEKDGIIESDYLTRQRGRLVSCFETMEAAAAKWDGADMNDAVVRLGCLLTWFTYRDRFDYSSYKSLVAMDQKLSENEHFIATAPPPQ